MHERPNASSSASKRADAPDPKPVLLVPGWSDTARMLEPCRSFLIESGWPESHVRCLSFHDRYGSNVEHASEIASALDDLVRTTRTAAVAVVAHSMGGLALRHLMLTRGPGPIATAVFVGTPHRGTWAAWLAWGRGGREMRPGSPFLEALNGRALPAGVRCHCLRTPIDTRVLPGSSAWLDGAECHTVRAPTHPRMLRHRGTLRLVRDLLLGDRAAA